MPKKSESIEKEKAAKALEKKEKAEQKVVKLSEEEYEKKVLELSNKGLTSEKIGTELKKQKINPSEYSKRISQILKSKNAYIKPDVKNITEKLTKIQNHASKNKQDKRAKRDLVRVQSKLRRLRIYFKEV